jgi:alkaline phosphatase
MKRNNKILTKLSLFILASLLLIFSVFTFVENNNTLAINTLQPHGIKNIIVLIGDGMGPVHEEAGRIYSGKALAWDSLPYQGTSITNSLSGVTDSAAAGTAMATGVLVSNGFISRDSVDHNLKGIMEYAIEAGKKTGVVTSAELYDATPAAYSAKANDRGNYDEIKASQVNSGIDLLIGESGSGYDSLSADMVNNGYTYITEKSGLNQSALSYEKIFATLPAITPYESLTPSAEELYILADFALQYLENDNGFMLMIEGAKIDKKSHQMNIGQMIEELMAFNKAVETVLNWAENRNDTLVIVTADHECGGLELLNGVTQANIKSGLYCKWNSWDNNPEHQASHTDTPVNYYIQGAYSDIMTETIIITDIFKISHMYLYDINHYDEKDVFTPHKTEQNLKLNVTYDERITGDKLIVSVSGGEAGNQYQYWIKTKIETDDTANFAKYRYIWHNRQFFTVNNVAEIDISENDIDESGKYNVFVRVSNGGRIIEELYGSYSSSSLGKIVITDISVNGRNCFDDYLIVNKNCIANILVKTNIGGNYTLYYNNTVIETKQEGLFFADFNSLNVGYNYIKVKASYQNSFDEKTLKIYVYDDFEADKTPVIKSLEGVTTGNGKTVFTMKVQYADNTPIADIDKNKFTYKLTSGQVSVLPSSVTVNGDYVDVLFNVDYKGRYGIYQTTATVSRNAKDGYDDIIIQYYDKYVRNASVIQTGNTTISAGASVVIEAFGFIEGKEGTEEYAFYREDAGGWVLIRDYSTSNQMIWTPKFNGQYIIQTRIRADDSGSYEACTSRKYTVGNTELSGDFNIKIYDYESGDIAEDIIAGRPYIIFADYNQSENIDLLYMFTLTSENLGTIYLNKFNPSPYLMFIPEKTNSYKITARAIDSGNFGFKDISTDVTINSYVELKLEVNQANYEALLSDGSYTIPSEDFTVYGSKPITLTYTVVYKGEDITVTNGVFDFVDSGYYDITIRVTDIYGKYVEKIITLTVIDSLTSLDFETEEQINYFNSVNPAGHTMNVVFDILSYEDAGLTAPSGCGDSLMKITPTHPDCGHLLFEIHNNYIIPSGSSISFKLYIQAPQSASNFYLRYWDNSADDVRNLSSNQWYDIVIHTTIDSPQNYIYLYLRNYDINPATNLNMYIDNLTIIPGWNRDDVFDFETEQQINYFNSVNPAGHTMNVVFDILSYEDAGLTAPSGCGDSLMKITPTHPDCGHLLFEIHNNYIIPSGSSISFKLYIQAPQSASNFYLRYWDNSADDVRNLSSNQWYDIVIHTTIDSPQNYIYLYLRNYAINPATNLNMYIDNLTISLP